MQIASLRFSNYYRDRLCLCGISVTCGESIQRRLKLISSSHTHTLFLTSSTVSRLPDIAAGGQSGQTAKLLPGIDGRKPGPTCWKGVLPLLKLSAPGLPRPAASYRPLVVKQAIPKIFGPEGQGRM